MSFLKNHPKILTLLLVLIAGIIINMPYSNFQNFLSQGDHGRDLYAAQAVFRGELPYKDFWWVYGPLMPYYYGLFFKIFGTQITSIILGKLILVVLGGILTCLSIMEICSITAAFLCACWFMLFHQDFFFTYNHIGGIDMILGVTWCLLSYIQKNSSKSALGALGFIFILCLIKINFGLAALVVSIITIGVCDLLRRTPFDRAKKYFYALAFIGLPLSIFAVYWYLLKDLSISEIRQCLPYLEGDQPYSMALSMTIILFAKNTIKTIFSTSANFTFALILNVSAVRCFYLFWKNKISESRKTILILALSMLGLFYVANFHEYLKSGVWYRGFWSQPISILITFILIDTAAQSINMLIRNYIFTFLALLMAFCWFSVLTPINAAKTQNHYLSLPRAGIYTTNPPEWISTVTQTTNYLNSTLKPNELFFALPYDCLYYYLTDKKSPTRQLIFFEHIKIKPEQERSVIAELEKNHVNYVLISNRAFARQETGLGLLGKTYCPLIAQYLQKNFVPIKRFGDWKNEPGWGWNHGTLILKRKVNMPS